MALLDNEMYLEDVKNIADTHLPWKNLQGKSILISGSTGLLGSFLIDVLMSRNAKERPIKIYALGRDEGKARNRFSQYWGSESFNFITHDINEALDLPLEQIDYVLHLASNTHPVSYAKKPISTITTNIIGTNNMLSFAVRHKARRFAFASSNEIYGENKGDVEQFDEKYSGYIDCNTLRAGYPESKRAGEALCQAYLQEYGLDVIIPRFTRSFGPTLLSDDTKALSQFIQKAVAGEDIVLKSDGSQFYSYTYVADAISGLLTILLKGKKGEAYNISDESCDIHLKDLAKILAEISGRKVIFGVPDVMEYAGYSKATKARLDGSKLKELGWRIKYNLPESLRRTVKILQSC